MRWLLGWQHLAPQTQLSGEEGVLERCITWRGLRRRPWSGSGRCCRCVCELRSALAGPAVPLRRGWVGRVSPHPAWTMGDGGAPRRVGFPKRCFIRPRRSPLPARDGGLATAYAGREARPGGGAGRGVECRGAADAGLLAAARSCFAGTCSHYKADAATDVARAGGTWRRRDWRRRMGSTSCARLMDPRRKVAAAQTESKRAAREMAGLWSLLSEAADEACRGARPAADASAAAIARARRKRNACDSNRLRVICWRGMGFYCCAICWRGSRMRRSGRDCWEFCRRLRRGARCAGAGRSTGLGAEQFCAAEAAIRLRASRAASSQGYSRGLRARTRLNPCGDYDPGERVAAVPGQKKVRYRNGSLVVEDVAESGLPDGGAATAPFAKRRRVTGRYCRRVYRRPCRPGKLF